MSLRGDLSTMPLDDVFAWIRQRAKRGVVTAISGDQERVFRVDGESVVSAGSSSPDDQLGALLLDQGLVSVAELEQAYAVQAETRVLLGKILLMIDAIDHDTLRTALENKIIDAVADVLSWPTGTFQFTPGSARSSSSEMHVQIGLDACVFEARARAVQWRRVRAQLPTLDVQLWVVRAERAAGVAGADKLLELVAAGHTPREMAKELRTPRLSLALQLCSLVEARAVAVERRSRSRRTSNSPPPIDELVEAARGRADGGDLMGALEIAQMAASLHAKDRRSADLHAELLAKVSAALAAELLSRSRAPHLLVTAAQLESLGLSEAELACARLVDGRFDLWSIIDRVPQGWTAAIIGFKRLLDRNVISLE